MTEDNKKERAKIRADRLSVAIPLLVIILISVPFFINRNEKIKENFPKVEKYCNDYVKTVMENSEIERRETPIARKEK